MHVVYILIFGFFIFQIFYGFWAAYLEVTPEPPQPPPLNKPVNIGLPEKVAMMEWEVLGSSTKAIHVEDINNEPINLN